MRQEKDKKIEKGISFMKNISWQNVMFVVNQFRNTKPLVLFYFLQEKS